MSGLSTPKPREGLAVLVVSSVPKIAKFALAFRIIYYILYTFYYHK